MSSHPVFLRCLMSASWSWPALSLRVIQFLGLFNTMHHLPIVLFEPASGGLGRVRNEGRNDDHHNP